MPIFMTDLKWDDEIKGWIASDGRVVKPVMVKFADRYILVYRFYDSRYTEKYDLIATKFEHAWIGNVLKYKDILDVINENPPAITQEDFFRGLL